MPESRTAFSQASERSLVSVSRPMSLASTERVNSGIGTSGALRRDVFAGQPSNSGRQGALNGRQPGLDLPAGEVGAVVGEDEFKVSHDGLNPDFR